MLFVVRCALSAVCCPLRVVACWLLFLVRLISSMCVVVCCVLIVLYSLLFGVLVFDGVVCCLMYSCSCCLICVV